MGALQLSEAYVQVEAMSVRTGKADPVTCPRCKLWFAEYVDLGYHLHTFHGLDWAESEREIKRMTVRHAR